MVLTGIRGGIGFLTRIPVGRGSEAWTAFTRTPVAFPLSGYLIGVLLILPVVLPLPAVTVALLFVIWLYVITGITHLDGIADLGDALVVHGTAEQRYNVMKDTTLGVGGVTLLVLTIGGVGLAAYGLSSYPGELRTSVGIILAAEVGAKLCMALIACFATASPNGMGAELTGSVGPRDSIGPILLSLPVVLITVPSPVAAFVLVSTVVGAFPVWWWARKNLDGINGDVFGATNEIARLVGLHGGLFVWML